MSFLTMAWLTVLVLWLAVVAYALWGHRRGKR